MGWHIQVPVEVDWKKRRLKNMRLRKIFEYADRVIRCNKKFDVDNYLRVGGLNSPECKEMLEKATGYNFDIESLDAKAIRQLDSISDWEFEPGYDKEWAYWSAYYFLKSAAKAEMPVVVSW